LDFKGNGIIFILSNIIEKSNRLVLIVINFYRSFIPYIITQHTTIQAPAIKLPPIH